MFPLTRPFRQALVTIALFVTTVVPTGSIAVMAWRINRPGHVRDVEVELRRQLGLQVTLEEVRYPRPGTMVFRGIVLRLEEPRGGGLAEIARADLVRVERADRELTLQLENPRLRGESPELALSHLGALLERSGEIPWERINVTAASCGIDLGRDDLQFAPREVAGELVVDPVMPAIRLAYRMPGDGVGVAAGLGADTRCELVLTRDRRTDPLVTSLALKTVEGLPLPARVLNVFFDAEDWLGENATVEGTLCLKRAGSKDWEAEFQGSLHEVDLGKLVGRRFPRHRLAGRARVAISTARWAERPNQGPGWVEVKGELLAGEGSIAIGSLAVLAREMRFRLSPRLARLGAGKSDVEFRALGLSFAMHSNGEIHCSGALGAEFPPDVVLAGATWPLAWAPEDAASVHGLIKTLFPVAASHSGVLVPFTSESSVMLSLPVPPEPPATVRRAVGGN
jgi:hypothetical protein